MKNKLEMCTEDYNMLREDINNYTYSWKTYNSSYKPKYSFERVYNAFQYRSANDLNGYPVVGIYNTYWGLLLLEPIKYLEGVLIHNVKILFLFP